MSTSCMTSTAVPRCVDAVESLLGKGGVVKRGTSSISVSLLESADAVAGSGKKVGLSAGGVIGWVGDLIAGNSIVSVLSSSTGPGKAGRISCDSSSGDG